MENKTHSVDQSILVFSVYFQTKNQTKNPPMLSILFLEICKHKTLKKFLFTSNWCHLDYLQVLALVIQLWCLN